MSKLVIPAVDALDLSLSRKIQAAIDSKTKPLEALGELEHLAKKIALVQQTLKPSAEGCRLLLFAADHGVAAAGVSAYPPEVTRQMVLNFLAGGAAANVFSANNNVDMTVVDAGVLGEPIIDSRLCVRRMGSGTKNFIEQPAMSNAIVKDALHAGILLGQECSESFVAFGEMGIGNTSAAALLVNKLKGYALKDIVGHGAGLNDSGVDRKLALLTQAAARTPPFLEPMAAMHEYGGFEIVMMVGAMIGSASCKKCLLIDGYIATAALIVAAELRPQISDYCIFTHRSAEPGHAIMLDGLGESGLLDMHLRLGEGTGAILAWPLVQCATRMLSDMASFSSGGVSTKV